MLEWAVVTLAVVNRVAAMAEGLSATGPGAHVEASARLLFDAVLMPHRSLSPTGFWVLMGVVAVASCGVGLAFFLAGAWPVVGFLGLDVALVYLAFRHNYRSGKLREMLQLSKRELIVRRISPYREVTTWTFQPYWLSRDHARSARTRQPAHAPLARSQPHRRQLSHRWRAA